MRRRGNTTDERAVVLLSPAYRRCTDNQALHRSARHNDARERALALFGYLISL
jgi:hypothetical protein